MLEIKSRKRILIQNLFSLEGINFKKKKKGKEKGEKKI